MFEYFNSVDAHRKCCSYIPRKVMLERFLVALTNKFASRSSLKHARNQLKPNMNLQKLSVVWIPSVKLCYRYYDSFHKYVRAGEARRNMFEQLVFIETQHDCYSSNISHYGFLKLQKVLKAWKEKFDMQKHVRGNLFDHS